MIRQIIDIFVPEHSGKNYILPTRVLGITLEQNAVIGTVVLLNNTNVTIKQVVKEPLPDVKSSRQAKITEALSALIKKVGPHNKVVTTLPSSLVLFKELSFPFSDTEKIQLTLPYEVESLLPFSVHEAAIDFLITHVNPKTSHTEVMIAAIQKKLVEEHLKPFNDAGIDVADISVDIIGLYNIYMRQAEQGQEGNAAMVDIGSYTSKVIFFTNNQLKHIRTIREGLLSSNKKQLWNTINFTIQSFADENPTDQKIKKVTVIGIKDKAEFDEANAEIAFPCELFNFQKFLTKTGIKLKESPSAVSLAGLTTALPLPNGDFFTLQPDRLTKQEKSRLNRQTITALLLSIGTLALLGAHAFQEINKLSSELNRSQKEVLQIIKKNFPSIKTSSRRDALDQASREVKKEENIWSSFSSQTRQSFLKYLYDLSTKIDRETLGLNLKKMVLNKKVISLDGSVRSFDAVEQFEHQLRETKLFSHVPDMQKVEFSVQLPLESKGAL